MREPGEIVAALPRPGPALKVVLGLIAALAVIEAIVVNWTASGNELFAWFAFEPGRFLAHDFSRPWTLVTSGVLTDPHSVSHAIWSPRRALFFSRPTSRSGGAAPASFASSR